MEAQAIAGVAHARIVKPADCWEIVESKLVEARGTSARARKRPQTSRNLRKCSPTRGFLREARGPPREVANCLNELQTSRNLMKLQPRHGGCFARPGDLRKRPQRASDVAKPQE